MSSTRDQSTAVFMSCRFHEVRVLGYFYSTWTIDHVTSAPLAQFCGRQFSQPRTRAGRLQTNFSFPAMALDDKLIWTCGRRTTLRQGRCPCTHHSFCVLMSGPSFSIQTMVVWQWQGLFVSHLHLFVTILLHRCGVACPPVMPVSCVISRVYLVCTAVSGWISSPVGPAPLYREHAGRANTTRSLWGVFSGGFLFL